MKQLGLWLAVCIFTVVGCGDRNEAFDEWVGVQGPYFVGSRLVYLDQNLDELVVTIPKAGDTGLSWTRIPVEVGARVVGVLETEEALMLQSPDEGVLQIAFPESQVVKSFAVESPYDRFKFQWDPPLVAGYFSEGAQGGEQTLFLNKGEITFVDPLKDEDAVDTMVLPTYGGAPLGIDFSPEVTFGVKTSKFAFVRWKSFVTIVKLGSGEKPVSVKLKPPDSEAVIMPGSIQFIKSGGKLLAFFLSQGTEDLFLIDVDLDTYGPGGSGVHVNIFPTAAGAVSFQPFTDAEDTLVIAVACATAKKVVMVYPLSSAVKSYSVDMTPREITIFDMPASGEKGALIFDNSGQGYTYYFVELDQLATKKSKAFHEFSLLAPVARAYMLPDEQHFLVIHPSSGAAATPMSLVALEDGSVVSLGGNLSVSSEQFSADRTRMYALAGKAGKTYLVAFDFTSVGSLSSRDINVTNGIKPTSLRYIESEGLLVLSDSAGEMLMLVPDDFAERGDAVQYFVPYLNGTGQ